MVSIGTSVAGPLYLAAVMGVLIGRFAAKPIFSDKKKISRADRPRNSQRSQLISWIITERQSKLMPVMEGLSRIKTKIFTKMIEY